MRALTVTLNPAVDVTYFLDGFRPGAIHTAREVLRVAGGKGNNVARVLRSLGVEVAATGFAGGAAGAFLAEGLRQAGVEPAFHPIPGESRTCLALVDRETGTCTEVREPGPRISPEAADAFVERFTRLVAGCQAVVFSGSLPPGLPPDYYRRLVALARQAGAYVVLDTSGEPLARGLAAGPDLVKPNRDELAAWAGREPGDLQEVLAAAARMRAAGARAVAVSLGAEGLVYLGPEGAWRLRPPAISAVNPVGSGDSLVAGVVAGLLQGRPVAEALRLGVACGAANATTPAVATFPPELAARLEPEVQVEPLG
ncbi:MAG: 1-phosphofructokinase [Firmicutes bacterium]|nr:1-phosphofructokinase [Bacillota bacterium]